jgi:hypothetical protein
MRMAELAMPCKSEKHIPDFSSERAPHMNIPETV